MLKKYFEPGALFSFPAYRALLLSGILTVIAMSAFPIALAVTVLDAGGSATTLGLILAVRVLSGVVLAPVGGVWVDRLPRKTILILADGFRAIMGSVVVFIDPKSISMWILGAIVVLMGVSDAFGGPAAGAIIPSILPDHLLPAGNVVRGIALKGSTIAGPGVAGIIVVSLGTHATYVATSVFFLLGAVLLLRINEGPKVASDTHRTTFSEEMREGLQVVWYYKWIAAMILMASVQLMMVVGVENVLLPVITKRDFGTASVFATSAALFSAGGAISAVICIKSKVKNPGLVSVVVWGLFVLAPLVLAFPSSKSVIFIAYFIAGFSVGPWEAFWATQVQREVPAAYQGRVFAIDYMGSLGLMPLGMALAGPLVNVFGEGELLIGVAVFHLFICAVVLLVPGVKQMKSSRPPYTPKSAISS
ncbi:major facilitator superfamily protein [Candidatus Planktophila dulcis]|uniref:Major facilitator superfamily protein n=1 Tax=Candidatus Planktophila dulcis TaxID=1884914 RepID=A0AAC9YTJ2_9ACTN|nr:MFS transporter [Candidatus Planktophila dulcis]ASY12262.1 major facilitator superfamily protein [Candidatus Planktophila dulcis]ASY21510.1 major facilitator superfamily protein [Candidatus Planktophila dulcis]